jgi:lipopolysaccharide O-acetyltransferase
LNETFLRQFALICGEIQLRIHSFGLLLSLKVGYGVRIRSPSYIRGSKNIYIGKNFVSGSRIRLECIHRYGGKKYSPSIKIGDSVTVNDDVHIAAVNSVLIGDRVLMASKIFISDHNHGSYSIMDSTPPSIPPEKRILSYKAVVIEDDVWIGEMVSVLPGSYIGKGSIIGANSVVIGYIPANCIAVGVPAKVIKFYSTQNENWEPVK